jgi:signal transduction histidine kinase
MMATKSHPPQERPDPFSRAGNIVLLIVVGAAYLATLGSLRRPVDWWQIGGLVVLGIAYTLLGIYALDWCISRGGWAVKAYFVAQIAIAGVIAYLSAGNAWLVLLPLAGQAVVAIPRRAGVALVCVALLLAVLVPVVLEGRWNMATSAILPFAAAIAFVVAFVQVAAGEQKARTEVEHLVAELGQANQRLRAYAVQAEELATVKERNRLAREIHDSLGHYLTTINVQLEAARALLGQADAPAAKPQLGTALNALTRAQTLTREGLTEVRRSVAALRASPTEGRSLAEALVALVEECRQAGIATDLVVRGAARPLASPVELTLFRTAQEGLTNVRRHSQAKHAEVLLDYQATERISLTLSDDGIGMDPGGETAQSAASFGLVGLRERVQLLGGQVHIQTAPGQGFRLSVEVPT